MSELSEAVRLACPGVCGWAALGQSESADFRNQPVFNSRSRAFQDRTENAFVLILVEKPGSSLCVRVSGTLERPRMETPEQSETKTPPKPDRSSLSTSARLIDWLR